MNEEWNVKCLSLVTLCLCYTFMEEKNVSGCLGDDVGRTPIKREAVGMKGRGIKTEKGMEREMWMYMVAAVGGWVKINKSDSLYLSA